MTKRFLFGAPVIALVFGLMVIGCFSPEEDGFKDRTINLTNAGENALFLTLQGGTWEDPTLPLKVALFEKFLDWDQKSGNISNLKNEIASRCTLEKENVIKIEFSKESAFGSAHTGSGIITLKKYSSAAELTQLFGALKLLTKKMDPGVWTIGKNEKVTITIK